MGERVWFGVGIFAHRVLPHGPVVWMGVLAVLLVAGWAVGGRGERVASILIGMAVAVAGVKVGPEPPPARITCGAVVP